MYHIHLIISNLIKNYINRVHSIGSSVVNAIANTIRSSTAIKENIKGNIKRNWGKEASAFARWRITQVLPGSLNLRAFGLVSVLCLTSFLTACAVSSGSDAPGSAAPDPDPRVSRSVFSHASYNFVGQGSSLSAGQVLGSVQVDMVTLLARLPEDLNASSIQIEYQLEGSELANAFFGVDSTGKVLFKDEDENSYGREFQLHYVVNVLNVSEFKVVARFSYTNATGELGEGEDEDAEYRVNVKIAAVEREPQITDFVRFDGKTDETVQNQTKTYGLSGTIPENSDPGTLVSGTGNLLTGLGISTVIPDDAEEQGYPGGFTPTIYYQLASAPGDTSCRGRYYVDNQDNRTRVRSEIDEDDALNYEAEGRNNTNTCALQASLNGVAYKNVVTGNLSAEDLENVEELVGAASFGVDASCTNNATAAKDLETCNYYAAVNIDLIDVNEAPELALTDNNNDEANNGITPEGDVGTAVALGGEVISAEGPANVTAADVALATVTYTDVDAADNPARLGMPKLSVSPLLPDADAANNLFYLKPGSGDGEATLMLNSTVLSAVDFETLNKSGYSGYRVTLEVADNRSADLTAEASFMLEVTDVIYKPVLFKYRSARVNTTSGIQNLLPGFAQFIDNGGPILGTVDAIDPESNSSDGIVYNPVTAIGLHLDASGSLGQPALIEGVVRQIAPNFVLSEGRLSLLGLGLRPLPDYASALPAVTLPGNLAYDFTITLNAYNPAAEQNATNGATLAISTKVSYDADSVLGFGGEPAVRFPSGLYAGAVPEGIPGTGNPAPLGVSVLDARQLASGTQTNLTLGAPNFYSLVQQADLLPLIGPLPPEIQQVLGGLFLSDNPSIDLSGTGNFDIDSSTGQVYLAANASLNFGLRPLHTLLVRTAANASVGLESSDYTVVLVTVLDTNTAPEIIDLVPVHADVTVNASDMSVSANIFESVPPGTVLARFTLTDDNPFFPPLTSNLNFRLNGEGAPSFIVHPTGAPVRDETTGTFGTPYQVVLAPPGVDYESTTDLRQTYNFTDDGQYVFDPSISFIPMPLMNASLRALTGRNVALEINAEIQNVNEPIELRVTDSSATPALSVESLSEVSVAEDEAEGTAVAYVHLIDPEGEVNATNVPTDDLMLPDALQGALRLRLVFEDSGPYYQLEVADAAILENAGDGRTFGLTVTVTENATGLVPDPVSVSFDLQITNENQNITGVILDRVSVSEQQALNLDGKNAEMRTLVAGLFNLTDIHPDYDETFPGTSIRLVDLSAAVRSINYTTDVADALEQEENFGLFELSVADDDAGTVSLLLKEGKLIDRALIGNSLTLNLEAFDPNGELAAGILSTVVDRLPVTVDPTDPDEIIFGDARNTDPRTPAVYTFEYTQSNYAEVVAGVTSCDGRDAVAANLTENIAIDGNCYPTIEIEASGEDRRYVVERDRSNQSYYEGSDDLAAVLRADETPGSFGVILTDADVNVSNLGVYQLNATGVLEDAADAFGKYFTLVANNSYAVNASGSDARPALVISQNVLAELNSSALPSGDEYLSLDTLDLNMENQMRTLSYFVVAGAEGTDGNNASRRAIAQINFEVNEPANARPRIIELNVTAAGLNEPAFSPVSAGTASRTYTVDLRNVDIAPPDRGCDSSSTPAEFASYTPICTEDNFTYVRENPSDNYVLTDNIVLTGDWTPIGDGDVPFTGNFHGNNFEISGLQVSEQEYAGLFGYINGSESDRVEISNLRIVAHSIVADNLGSAYAGVLAGRSDNSNINFVSVNLSHAEGMPDQLLLNASAIFTGTADAFAGGLIGSTANSNISQSYAYVAGNLIASSQGATSGEIDVRAGGLVGLLTGGSVDHSYVVVEGNILVEQIRTTGDDKIFGFVGGLIGQAAGGMVSTSYALVSGRVSARDVTGATDQRYVLSSGGLMGRLTDSGSGVINSYAIVEDGVYLSINDNARARGDAGGLVAVADVGTNIMNSYAFVPTISGAHSNNNDAGGVVGRGSGVVTNSYYTTYTTRSTFSTSSPGLRTLSQLQEGTGNTYVGWSSRDIWFFGTNSELPILVGLPLCPTGETNCRLTTR